MAKADRRASGAKRPAAERRKHGRSPAVIPSERVRPPKAGEPASPREPVFVREALEYSDGSVEVRPTPGRGRGVFALRRFLPGELVLHVSGQLVYGKGYGSDYCLELSPCPRRGPRFLEPAVPGGLVNHSCDPNCELLSNAAGHAFLVARCCVEPGAELTFDYGYEFLGDGQVRCRCGADGCRGWIVAAGHLPKLKRHLAGMR